MTTKTFVHQFEPAHESPWRGSEIELTVQQIEAAGYLEMLQSAGANLGSWSILESLLQEGVPRFVFKQPLGLAREVKVAASGLFGRFVARAYLTRYMGLCFFGHLGSRKVMLDGNELEIARKKRSPGDLPDWVACASGLANLTIAEAKGSHDPGGPRKRLKGAWKQAQRVDVLAAGKRLPVKRIAIVTRWASASGGAKIPIIAVRDPVDPGDPDAPERLDEAAIGLARLHVASLLEPLGFAPLADSIRSLLSGRRLRARDNISGKRSRIEVALTELDKIMPRRIAGAVESAEFNNEGLIGALVTRAGPVPQADLAPSTVQIIRDLDLRPTFVGIEREVVRAVVAGDPDRIRKVTQRPRGSQDPDVSTDAAGTWLAHVGERVHVE